MRGGSAVSGFGGGGAGSVSGIASLGSGGAGIMDFLKSLGSSIGGGLEGIGNFMDSGAGGGFMDLAKLGLINRSMGIQDKQIGILGDQENRAATAQNYQTGNSLSLALQNTTPGTAEHERIKQAIADGQYQV